MFSAIRKIAMSAIIAASTLATLGAGQAFAAYAGACSSTDNQHAYIESTGTKHLTSVSADVTFLRDTATCTGGSSGSSWVLPVNLQGGTVPFAVQIGWGRIGTSSLDWYYTPVDYNGVMSVPSGSHTKPIVGHNYTFFVTYVPATNQWEYSVYDNTAETSQHWLGYASNANTNYGLEEWAGFEVWNAADQIGGAGTYTTISSIDRHYSDGTSAYMITTSLNTGCCSPYAWQSYWHASSGLDGSGHSVISAYTSSH